MARPRRVRPASTTTRRPQPRCSSRRIRGLQNRLGAVIRTRKAISTGGCYLGIGSRAGAEWRPKAAAYSGGHLGGARGETRRRHDPPILFRIRGSGGVSWAPSRERCPRARSKYARLIRADGIEVRHGDQATHPRTGHSRVLHRVHGRRPAPAPRLHRHRCPSWTYRVGVEEAILDPEARRVARPPGLNTPTADARSAAQSSITATHRPATPVPLRAHVAGNNV